MFTVSTLPDGRDIAWHMGRAHGRHRLAACYPPGACPCYVLQLSSRRVVDAIGNDAACDGFAHLINDYRGSGRRSNVRFTANGGVKTLRSVHAGKELYVDYGPQYSELITRMTPEMDDQLKQLEDKGSETSAEVGHTGGVLRGAAVRAARVLRGAKRRPGAAQQRRPGATKQRRVAVDAGARQGRSAVNREPALGAAVLRAQRP